MLSREEVIKAMECCAKDDPFSCFDGECPYSGSDKCFNESGEALALVRELIEENEDKDKTITSLLDTIKDIQADTVRKMQESIKKHCISKGIYPAVVELCEALQTLPCCDTYEGQAEYLIANGVTVQEWISVEERLPEQDGKYLAYTRKGFTVLSYYYALEGAFGFEHWDVTHWMPLPEPPKGE